MKKKKLLTDRSGELQEEYLEAAAKRLADDIDAEIVRNMLVESGWHEVKLWVMPHEVGDQIDMWVHKNIKGEVWTRGIVWLFKEDSDAMWFKMRWLS
jgi:hypothetical protein